ncbi:uncharacterized protein FFB20_10977 [Fusarium fujikuroi]|nr:uncharacterized protein FFB20_10977 [Fusarium fujikuroi]SCO24361.1 uncharacterized protein FFE2_15943 [Fusarium fujikuroi]SCO25526.1 uncharacterized protein FFC1_15568 [Fusarium fujikuroi]SCO54035.1 uncharacterized protein FFNC_15304 [Fusarium fujikuroi]
MSSIVNRSVSSEDATTIHENKAAYCRLADTNQWDRFGDIILPNATFEFQNRDGSIMVEDGVPYTWSSRDEWASYFKHKNKDIQTIHIIGPAEMEQTATDTIKAIWSVIFHLGSKEAHTGLHGTGGGHYYEVWKKIGDVWLMESMKLVRLYWKATIN